MKNSIFISTFLFVFNCKVMAVVVGDGVDLGSSNIVAAGSLSIAAGQDNTASGYGMSMGWGNVSADGSLALGDSNIANSLSFASGLVNQIDANSFGCAAIGEGNYSSCSASTVLLGGYNAMGFQWGSAAIGNSNSLQSAVGRWGSGNVLIGQLNTIDQSSTSASNNLQGTILVGCDNTSSQTFAYVFGKGNIGQTDTVTVGTYGAQVSNAAVILGNGASNSSRSNGMVIFKNGLVEIPGTLSVGGSSVLTQANSGASILGQGFLKKCMGAGSTAETDALMAIGNYSIAGDQAVAIGTAATASAAGSIALGTQSNAATEYATVIQGGDAAGIYSFAADYGHAFGDYSIAMMAGWAFAESSIAIGGFDTSAWDGNYADGVGSVALGGLGNYASGKCSYAMGHNSTTCGRNSYSIGYRTKTNGYQVSMGSQNLSANNLMPNMENESWAENGALFELGNGKPNDQGGNNEYSNAITTLKNGQTTLTNKAWKANTGNPLADPTPTTDSNGEALVVEGHTRLKGKVVIEQAQGDISMGIYGN